MFFPRRRTKVEVRHFINQYVTRSFNSRTTHTNFYRTKQQILRQPSIFADFTEVKVTCSHCNQSGTLKVASVKKVWLQKLKWLGVSLGFAIVSTPLFYWSSVLGMNTFAGNFVGIPAVLSAAAAIGTFIACIYQDGNLGCDPEFRHEAILH